LKIVSAGPPIQSINSAQWPRQPVPIFFGNSNAGPTHHSLLAQHRSTRAFFYHGLARAAVAPVGGALHYAQVAEPTGALPSSFPPSRQHCPVNSPHPFYSSKQPVSNPHYRWPPASLDHLPASATLSKGATPPTISTALILAPRSSPPLPEHFHADHHRWVPLSTAARPPHRLSAPGEPVGRFPALPSCSPCHRGKEPIPTASASSCSGELGSLPCPWSIMDRGAASPTRHAPGPPIYPLKNYSISSLILKVYTEVPHLSVNSSTDPDS
jgi:hypothetical protein